MPASISYSTRFYRSNGAILTEKAIGGSNAGGILSACHSESVPTTDIDFAADLHFMIPAATADGTRVLSHFWLASATAMDTGTPTLVAKIVFRTVLGTTTTDTNIYTATNFQAAITGTMFDGAGIVLPKSDNGFGHFIFTATTAASAGKAASVITFIPYIR